MKYIDAEKLIAEIERRIKLIPLNYVEVGFNPSAEATNQRLRDGLERTLNSMKEFITSLQQEQPEVELEKEISKWLEDGDITDTRFDDYDDSDIERTARHFYELGFNARKEE